MDRGSAVLFRGSVRGNGYEGACDVLARKHQVSMNDLKSPPTLYTDCSLIGVPTDAPDGIYTVCFEDHRFIATRHLGAWMPCGDPIKV